MTKTYDEPTVFEAIDMIEEKLREDGMLTGDVADKLFDVRTAVEEQARMKSRRNPSGLVGDQVRAVTDFMANLESACHKYCAGALDQDAVEIDVTYEALRLYRKLAAQLGYAEDDFDVVTNDTGYDAGTRPGDEAAGEPTPVAVPWATLRNRSIRTIKDDFKPVVYGALVNYYGVFKVGSLAKCDARELRDAGISNHGVGQIRDVLRRRGAPGGSNLFKD